MTHRPILQPHTKTAIVLFNLGGPDSLSAVKPFLFNLFNDPAIIGAPNPFRWLIAKLISSRRAPVAQEIYAQIGGCSPLLANTQAQAQALQTMLEKEVQVRVFIAMRYWHPMSDQVAAEVKSYQPDHIILLPLYPQFSTTTTGSSFKEWDRAARQMNMAIPTTRICCYPTQPEWISAQVRLVREAIASLPEHIPYRLLFSAHGLPESVIAKGDGYQAQVEQTTQAVLKQLAIADVEANNCYQSRVGPMKWIGPSTEDEIRRAGQDGKAIILIPIAFVSEHSETLVELDIEYRELAHHHGVAHYIRVPTVSVAPEFITGLATICRHLLVHEKQGSDCKARLCPKACSQCPYEKTAA